MPTKIKKRIEEKIVQRNISGYTFQDIEELEKKELLSLFKKMSLQISHIYGSQKNSFLKMVKGGDRKTHILSMNGKDVGILVYKDGLQNEYMTQIIDQFGDEIAHLGYIELKSLFLYDRESMGKGYIYLLIMKLINELPNYSQFFDASGIFVTVSKERADSSFKIMNKLGFKKLGEEKDKYIQGETEILLFYPFDK